MAKIKPGEARNPYGRGGKLAYDARPHVDAAMKVVTDLVADETAPDEVRLSAALAVLRMAKGETP